MDRIKPRLRPVEAFPIKAEGQKLICLRDPHRISPQVLVFPQTVALILSLLNGRNDLRDIQAALLRRLGQIVPFEALEEMVEQLDENFYLEGERFERRLEELKDAFAKSPSRQAVLAGQAYETEPEALVKQLGSYYEPPDGPGPGPDPAVSGLPAGLAAPHIDFVRGGPCYAWAYRQMEGLNPPALVVILGTAHSPTENFFVLCDKDFETPLGPARCEKDLAGELAARLGGKITAGAFTHRQEHSIEFQAVWLKKVFAGRDDFTILPVLCGSLYGLIERGLTPDASAEYTAPLEVLSETLAQWREAHGHVLVLASVDLSHVGPQFGDNFRVTDAVRSGVRDYDLNLLDLILQGDFRGFYDKLARDKDRNRVCGLASLYAMARLLQGSPGRRLAYDQWVDNEGQGLVSFAGLVFP